MPKARTPSVAITFGGELRHLIYDFNALAELEDVAGTYRSEVAHMKAVRAVLWAGLLAETLDARGRETKRTLSLVQVGDILTGLEESEVDLLIAAIKEAQGISDPPPDPTAASETPAPA